MNFKKRYLFFDDMELYQDVLNYLCKRDVIFDIKKNGCHILRQPEPKVSKNAGQGQSIGGAIIRPRDRAAHGIFSAKRYAELQGDLQKGG